MKAIICLHCLTLADPVCDCQNVATIVDIDNSINIYVEDIRTCRLADVVFDFDHTELARELLEPFDTQTYIDYKPIRDTHLNFQPYTPKNDYVRQTPDIFDRGLMGVLDKYVHSTASIGRIGSTYQQPNKKDHS